MTERIRQGLGGLCTAAAIALVAMPLGLSGADVAGDIAGLGALAALVVAVVSLVTLARELLRGT